MKNKSTTCDRGKLLIICRVKLSTRHVYTPDQFPCVGQGKVGKQTRYDGLVA